MISSPSIILLLVALASISRVRPSSRVRFKTPTKLPPSCKTESCTVRDYTKFKLPTDVG